MKLYDLIRKRICIKSKEKKNGGVRKDHQNENDTGKEKRKAFFELN